MSASLSQQVGRQSVEAPQDPGGLNDAAQRKMQAGDLVGARSLLEAAVAADPSRPSPWVNLAAVLHNLGAPADERAALDRALALDPRNLRALLQSGGLYEMQGDPRTAAAVYRRALESAPRGANLPGAMQAHLQHAARAVSASRMPSAA